MKSRHFDIVCVCTQDWEGMWTRKQRFMREFAHRGHRVLFVEFQFHWLCFLRCLVRLDRFDRVRRFRESPRLVAPNLYVATPPIVLPWYMRISTINRLNKSLWIGPFIERCVQTLQMTSPVLWLYPVDSEPLIGALDERLVVFDCVDDWSTFEAKLGLISSTTMWSYEKALLEKADIVFTTAPHLYSTRKPLANGEVHLVPNAAELEHFRQAAMAETTIPSEIEQIPPPRIGFVGNVQFWLDFDLLRFAALERPDWSYVFVGPVNPMCDVAKIRDLPNVHLLGRREYANLPGYLKAFDVCLNPYRSGPLAEACSPLKLYEYLASGKPIVSSEMPEARNLQPHVRVAASYADFVDHIAEALAEDTGEAMVQARLSEASKHTWEKRFEQVYRVVLARLGY